MPPTIRGVALANAVAGSDEPEQREQRATSHAPGTRPLSRSFAASSTRDGPREQISLAEPAPEAPQDVEVLGRLEALGDDVEIQRARHAQDRVDDRAVAVAAAQRGDERAVDLQARSGKCCR